MKIRPVEAYEQPHRLHAELQKAVVVERLDQRGIADAEIQGVGVPHGVREALVLARGVRVDHRDIPLLYFCDSHHYRVLANSLDGADDQNYPPIARTEMGWNCDLPKNGHHAALLRVSLNGSLRVIVDAIGDEASVIERAEQLVAALV